MVMYLEVLAVVSRDRAAGLPSDVHIYLHVAQGGEQDEIAPGVMTDHSNYNTPSCIFLSLVYPIQIKTNNHGFSNQ